MRAYAPIELTMSDRQEVSLRERVKAPPSQLMIDAYYMPAVAAGIRYQFDHEMRIHLAHVLMLDAQGIVGRADVSRILRTLLELQQAGASTLNIDYSQEDLYSYVESHVVRALGRETGGRMHTARSRNDLHTTSWRLALREHLLAVLDQLNGLRETSLRLADHHAGTVMPGYTHSQHAQPIPLGYYLLTFAEVLGRDHSRLFAALERCDCCPLGAGALSTTGFPIDRNFVRDLLGFRELVEIAYDAVSCRDDVYEAAACMAVLATTVSRLATDLQAWNTMEYAMIELADEYSSVSSIMPQKKNPKALEYAKSAAAYVTGALTTVLACAKNTALGDVNDGVTAINVPALEAATHTRSVLGVMDGVLRTLTVRTERMRHLADIGFGSATELADVIVRETGLSFRMAHNVVGTVVREAIEAGRTAITITSADLDRASQSLFGKSLAIDADIVRTEPDPGENIRLRTIVGGPANVSDMVKHREHSLAADRSAVAAMRSRIDDATQRLNSMAHRIAAKT